MGTAASSPLDLSSLEDLVIGSARGRRAAQAPQAVVKRELTPADLELILNPPATGIGTPSLKSLRDTHHALARLLASGVPPTEASLITGHSPSRISILKQDPMFQELLAYYRENAAEAYVDVHKRLAAVGLSAIGELQERLEENPEGFSNKSLMELAEFTLDRSVTADTKPQGRGGASIQINFVKSPTPAPTIEGTVVDAQVLEIEGPE